MSARGQYGSVPVAPIREAFEASGVDAYTVALRIGWYGGKGGPDSHRVRRALGMKLYPPSRGYPPRYRESMTIPTALALLDAIGVIPAEVPGAGL